jgi:hypothetical protein
MTFQSGTLLTIAAQGITPNASPLLFASNGFFDWFTTPLAVRPITIFITGQYRTNVYAIGSNLMLDSTPRRTVIQGNTNSVIDVTIKENPDTVIVPI